MRLSAPPSAAASRSTSSTVSIAHYRRRSVTLTDSTRSSARIGEIAGGTAAECAAICCCVPCGVINLVIYSVVKLPAAICRRAHMKRRRRRIIAMRKKAAVEATPIWSSFDLDDGESVRMREEWGIPAAAAPSPEVAAMEEEMWTSFYETGFWRSPSQREDMCKSN